MFVFTNQNSFSSLIFFRIIFVLLFFFTSVISYTSLATTYYSRSTGNWNDNNTWSTTGFGGAAAPVGTYPGSGVGDVAIISRRTITVTATPANSITSITIDQSSASANLSKLLINAAGVTLTTGSLTMSDNNLNAGVELEISSSAQLNVTGNVNITRSTNSSQPTNMRVYLLNTARMSVGGNFTYNYYRADQGENTNEVLLANTSQLLITGSFTLNFGHANMEQDNVFDFSMTQTPTFSAGAFSIIASAYDQTNDNINLTMAGGNFTCTGFDVDLSNANGGECDFTLDQNGGTFICNSFTGDIGSVTTGEIVSAFYHFDGGTFTCNTDLSLTISALSVGTSDNKMYLDGGSFHVKGNMFATQSGGGTGDIYVYLNQNTTASASAFAVDGNLEFNHTGGDDMRIYVNQNSAAAAGTFTVGGNMKFEHSGGDNMRFYAYKNSVVTIGSHIANFTSNDADLLTYDFDLADINVNGDFTVTNNAGAAGNVSETVLTDIKGCTVDITGNISLTQASGENDKNDDIQWKMTRNAATGAVSTVNIGGNFTLNGVAGNDMFVTADYNSIINISGQLFLNQDGCDLMYCNIGSTAGSPTFTVGSLNMDYTGGTSNIMTLSSSAVFQSNGNVTLVSTAQAKTVININSTSNFKLRGNFVRSAAPSRFGDINCASTATITYNGISNTQIVAGNLGQGSDALTYGNVVIDNTFGTYPQLSTDATEGNATIPSGSTLTFTNGVVLSSSSAIFVVNSGASATSGNAGSFNDGPIKKVGNTAFVFPVGNNGVWARIGMSALTLANAATEFTAQYLFAASPNDVDLNPGLHHVSHVEYWDLARTLDAGNDAACQVTLYWEDHNRSGIINNVAGLADVTVAHYWSTTSLWTNQGGSAVGGASGSITSTVPFVNFSPVTLASKGDVSPLPVELLSFTAENRDDHSVDISWVTKSELNNDHFEIQRASDGINFETIMNVKGSGNSNITLNYTEIDYNPLKGNSYYRIKQFDFDGKEKVYPPVKVTIKNSANQSSMEIYPNPSANLESVKVNLTGLDPSKSVLVVLRDINGKEVYTKIISTGTNGEATTALDIFEKIAPGVYFVVASSDDKIYNKKLIIE